LDISQFCNKNSSAITAPVDASIQRYFITLAYSGTSFYGWQKQPNAPTIQAVLEEKISIILRQPIEVTGCGRTDTGVHARFYVAHFDASGPLPNTFLAGINSLLPVSVSVFSIVAVSPNAHARFDAYERAYEYHLTWRKDPFRTETAWWYPQARQLQLDTLNQVALMLPDFKEFYPFCKTHSGVDHYRCDLKTAYWEPGNDEHSFVFHIRANRFLRGMVRLIVGTCIQVAQEKITQQAVYNALTHQVTLPKALSVPPEGLFLTDVCYPYDISP
jgi:tRNA pseudouridine38-40 synthase